MQSFLKIPQGASVLLKTVAAVICSATLFKGGPVNGPAIYQAQGE